MSKSIKKNFGFTQKPTVGKAPTTEEKSLELVGSLRETQCAPLTEDKQNTRHNYWF